MSDTPTNTQDLPKNTEDASENILGSIAIIRELKDYFNTPGIRKYLLTLFFPRLAAALSDDKLSAATIFKMANTPFFRFVISVFNFFSTAKSQFEFFSKTLVVTLAALHDKDALDDDHYAAVADCGDPDDLAKVIIQMIEHGVPTEERVKVLAQKNPGTIASILGVLKVAGLMDTPEAKANMQAVINNQVPECMAPIVDMLSGKNIFNQETMTELFKHQASSPALKTAIEIFNKTGLMDTPEAKDLLLDLIKNAAEIFDADTVPYWENLAKSAITPEQWKALLVFAQSHKDDIPAEGKAAWINYVMTNLLKEPVNTTNASPTEKAPTEPTKVSSAPRSAFFTPVQPEVAANADNVEQPNVSANNNMNF